MTESLFGDGVDNDCDGLIDEELCTAANRGVDTDGEEKIDEDCALTRTVAEGRVAVANDLYFVVEICALILFYFLNC